MNKEQKYKVTTENGKERFLYFTESVQDGEHYGNGIYVSVKREDGEYFHIDCRYIKGYQFSTICENWIKDYYGKNLLSYEMQN